MRYLRISQYDKRIAWGDDYAADAWLDTETGRIIETTVDHDPNKSEEKED